MADIMMQLGAYQFGVDTAAYQELTRTTEYRWQGQDRIDQHAALQYTGPGSDSITLSGVVFPEYKGGTGQPDALRTLAAEGQPLLLVDGLGYLHGRWVLERIEEQQAVFAQRGLPRRQQFSLQLRKYDDGANL